MNRIFCLVALFVAMSLFPSLIVAQNKLESTGNVGIGTTSPVVRLSVYGTADDSGAISLQSVANSRFYISQGGALLKMGGTSPGTGAINILNTGKVGIGTNAPTVLLDVNGDFRLGTNTGGTAYAIGFTRTGNPQLFGTGAGGLLLGGDATGADAAILPSGDVGIGTASPAYRLDVQGGSVNIGTGANTAYRAGAYLSMGNMSYSNAPYIAFNAFLTTSDIPTGQNMFTPNYNAGGGLVIRADAGGSGLHFLQRNYNNGTPPYNLTTFTEALTLTAAGNVGIGTVTTDSFKLAVNGSIGARKIKVTQQTWADFVFQDDYHLPTLMAVEKYISANHHLPDVPSAEEVAEHGLDVGDMNKKLLQKVEELTLYLIDLQKTNEALKAENAAILKRIEKLEGQ